MRQDKHDYQDYFFSRTQLISGNADITIDHPSETKIDTPASKEKI